YVEERFRRLAFCNDLYFQRRIPRGYSGQASPTIGYGI
ncbi:MAG: hypothetical protein ACI9QN_000712, partial [Arcticibacterium sp.]